MELNALTAISPIDGRYRKATEELGNYFSESALIRYRLMVEVEYFIALCELPVPQLADFNKDLYNSLRDIYKNFTTEDATKVKEIEKVTNHDVKAVEYFLKDQLDKLGVKDHKEFVHFGLTSQDINNTSVPKSLKDALIETYLPLLDEVLNKLKSLAKEWKHISMLARTHGQPASPTKLGKEIQVFVERIEMQREQLLRIPYSAKFGGATGNFNAHHFI